MEPAHRVQNKIQGAFNSDPRSSAGEALKRILMVEGDQIPSDSLFMHP